MTDQPSWRILITNVTLASRTGTETVVRDLAQGLMAAGHQPMVYSPELGEIAQEIRDAGVGVVSDLTTLPDVPHIVHGHHHVETIEALLRFPESLGLFVCHDRQSYASAPPRLDRIRRYVAVDFNCLERLSDEYGLPAHLTSVIFNTVDTRRFAPRPELPPRPRRALVFSNNAGPGTHLAAVRDACRRLDLPLDVVGAAAGHDCRAPEQVLGEYDLVFAKGRCALEAMAVGTAVVLCDTTGLGPMVTTAELTHLRQWNFGMRLLRDPLDPAEIVRRIERYDPVDAQAVSAHIREHAQLDSSIEQYLRLYRDIWAEGLRAPSTFAQDLHEYVNHLAKRVGELELQLTAYRRPERMEALSDAECAQIVLRIVECPLEAVCGETVHAQVEIANTSARTLASALPYPIQFSYRWLDEDSGRMVVDEGVRTTLRPPLAPEGTGKYFVTVVAPDEPGRYRLRVTLVQEWVRWLDILDPPLSSDRLIEVVREPRPILPGATAR